jgi:hypothetical protein
MYPSFTDLKMTPNDTKRKKDEMVMINTTRPYIDERNLTYPFKIGEPRPLPEAKFLNHFIIS